MKIAYGVFGYGRGHATRALSVLPALCAEHAVAVFAGGDAYAALSAEFAVRKIPAFGYHYSAGRRSAFLTLARSAGPYLDVLMRGTWARRVEGWLQEFRPDVVISDAEPWTHHAARRLGIPRIGFDHVGIMAYCRVPMSLRDRVLSVRDVMFYHSLTCQPDRVIVSSFYPGQALRRGVMQVGPLLRDVVHRFKATRGDHLLVYFNNGRHQLTAQMRRVLRALRRPVRLYGAPETGSDGSISYLPPCNRQFVEDLAGARAVISTAGNQLVGEALHFGKPLLVIPENSVEQRMNADAVQRLGIGEQATFEDFSVARVEEFLSREEQFLGNIRRQARDGRAESLEAIRRCLRELDARDAGAEPA